MSKAILVRKAREYVGVVNAHAVPYSPYDRVDVQDTDVGWFSPELEDQNCYYVQWVNGRRSYWGRLSDRLMPDWLEVIHEDR